MFEDLKKRTLDRQRERRATPRVAVELEWEERVGTSRYFRITTDLSTFGLSARQGYAHELGTKVKLVLQLPDEVGTPIEVDAEVVGTYDARGGMRLAFRNPSVEAVRRIHKFLAARSA
ncbi:MAG: PilZ domain-containing protein [Myxococcota bacterium]